MAKPIDIGLVLEGQDAIDFINHMKNPVYTQDAIDCMKMALASAERKRKNQSAVNE
jgi:hypothetical protein